MPACDNCGGFVTRDFARVFGDNEGTVQACLECSDRTAIRDSGVVTETGGRR